MKTKILVGITVLVAGMLSQAAMAATLYSCPLDGAGGDQVPRGFYVTNYPGSTLDTVTLTYYPGSGDGAYTVSLTARLSAYDGTTIGTPQSQTVNIVGGAGASATFSFGNAPVPAGSTVTFSQVLVSGPVASPVLFYDVGVGPCTNITQTDGTTPPLDSVRRDSVGVSITGSTAAPPAAVAAVPTLAEYSLVALAALLAVLGLAAARRRG